MQVGDKLLEWSTYEITKWRVEDLQEQGDERSEDELFARVGQDSDIFEMEWEDLTERLTELIKERNPRAVWYGLMSNFGWRGIDGEGTFHAETGKEFLRGILPKTDCTFTIYAYGDHGFAVNNSHHDSPVGKEWYYLTPALGEAGLDEALDAATEATSKLTPGVAKWTISDAWDWDPPHLRLSDAYEDIPKAAAVIGGLAFCDSIDEQGIDLEVDLSSLYEGEPLSRCSVALTMVERGLGATSVSNEAISEMACELLEDAIEEGPESFGEEWKPVLLRLPEWVKDYTAKAQEKSQSG